MIKPRSDFKNLICDGCGNQLPAESSVFIIRLTATGGGDKILCIPCTQKLLEHIIAFMICVPEMDSDELGREK